jgi:hypothetical protein
MCLAHRHNLTCEQADVSSFGGNWRVRERAAGVGDSAAAAGPVTVLNGYARDGYGSSRVDQKHLVRIGSVDRKGRGAGTVDRQVLVYLRLTLCESNRSISLYNRLFFVVIFRFRVRVCSPGNTFDVLNPSTSLRMCSLGTDSGTLG